MKLLCTCAQTQLLLQLQIVMVCLQLAAVNVKARTHNIEAPGCSGLPHYLTARSSAAAPSAGRKHHAHLCMAGRQ
jgi:hypothetical protein